MLTDIITALIVLFLLALVIILVVESAAIIFWIPAVIITYAIISTCTIGIPLDSFGFDNQYIYPAGYESVKLPWHDIKIIKNTYEDIELVFNVRTSDRYALEYTFELQDHKWEPRLFASKYNCNTDNYVKQETKRLQPIVDRVMSQVSAQYYYYNGGEVTERIRAAIIPNLDLRGLTYNPSRYTTDNFRYVDWFSGGADMGKIDMMYICDEYSGMCNALGEAGISKGPDYYPPSSEYTEQPTPTPEPTPIYMQEGGVSSQEELNAIMDDIIANPDKYTTTE
ncbi:hypothetical protein KHC33_12155 [Methanospirillum sp. J.3.6.1-F.2.7.3]|uniref:Uncharacterized protein n=1 Tax=Methanospirillum purgamenti TaxID=2834276 RepID=A0A8E7B092_9EURY|nr:MULTISPECIES: hypothetical protein [Methanospirillum]MDX8550386.1 hypothetical protein [Methanospirillum hungatei]QVV88083.1 hypothetical protein KHC33_12155 [Methanospirillum sp. J.3.6.1-F.2.7.3]